MTNEVGTITLKADSTGIVKGTDALRQMEKQADRTEKETKGLEKTAGRMGATFGRIAGVLSVGLFARAVIKNTIEQENAVAQLNQTLRSTGRYTEEASEALQAHATALQTATTYGDEAIISAQSQLLTFTKLGGEVFPQATEAVLNLATKMQGDLKGAVVQLGKALNDPVLGITALTRSGIQFTQQQKDQIKTLVESNNILGAQKIILAELETQFGGSARAARETFGGALAGLQNQIGELLEGKGGGLKGATAAINDLTVTLTDPKVQEGFGAIINGFFRIAEWAAKAAAGVAGFGEELAKAIGGIDKFDLDDRLEQITDLQAQQQVKTAAGYPSKRIAKKIAELKAALQTDLDGGLLQAPRATDNVSVAAAAVAENIAPIAAPTVAATIKQEVAAKQEAKKATDELRESEAALTEQKSAAVEVMEAMISPAEQMRDQLQFELELQGLSNTERQKRIALMYAETDATTDLGRTISEQVAQLAANDELIGAMDNFRAHAADAFVSIADGSKSAKEAFSDFMGSVRDMILRMLAEKLIEKLFGAFGSTAGGGSGGLITGLFSSILGKAHGGPVSAGTPYIVGERGPELIVPQQSGTVIPNNQMGGSVVVNIDARETDNPGRLLSLVPLIQAQVEQGVALKLRRGYL